MWRQELRQATKTPILVDQKGPPILNEACSVSSLHPLSALTTTLPSPMALMINSLPSTQFSNLHSRLFINSFSYKLFQSNPRRKSCQISLSSGRNFAIFQGLKNGEEVEDGEDSNCSAMAKKRLSEQSSWEAKDAFGNDYLYRLFAEADNTNITVGARAGVIDDLFAGNFLGRDADIVFDYRQKVTRSFEHLQGDYYIAPLFLDKVVCHIVKNYMAHLLNAKVPLILGIWGGKGQGKTFQAELIFRAMGVEPVIMSAGELESERAGEPGKLIRERYRAASQVVQNHGKLSCLMINDLDAGIGRFGNTQVTVNNQIVVGTLMNLADNPTRVSVGQNWRESDTTHRIPIIVTGNDFSTIYAPLIRDGRMEKFYWQPNREDIVNIVHRMYEKDGISRDEVVRIVETFPNQALDFYGAMRSRTYDRSILKWVGDIGGVDSLGDKLLSQRKGDELPIFVPPEQNFEALLESGNSLLKEHQLINESNLAKEYMKNMDE